MNAARVSLIRWRFSESASSLEGRLANMRRRRNDISVVAWDVMAVTTCLRSKDSCGVWRTEPGPSARILHSLRMKNDGWSMKIRVSQSDWVLFAVAGKTLPRRQLMRSLGSRCLRATCASSRRRTLLSVGLALASAARFSPIHSGAKSLNRE